MSKYGRRALSMTVAVSLLLLSLFPFVLVIGAEDEESHTWQVSSGLDDAGGEISGGWWLTAVGPLYSDNQVDRLFYTGQRFTGINITSGSTITSAKLIMTSRFDYAVNGTRQMRVQAEDVDDASAFSDWTNFAGRSRTSASVLWNFTEDPYVNSSHLSPDLKDVIQEVIDRSGWKSGNALVIFTSQTFWQQWDLRFWHHDGAPDKAPKLTITWIPGSGVVEVESSFTWQVSTGLDDANGEGEPGGYWRTTALGPLYSDNQVDRLFYTGQRFTGINITSGSTITSARLNMTSRFDYPVNDTRQFRIQAEDVDHASQFSTQADYLARPRTSASVLWNFTEDPYVNSSHLSPDLKDVIQEVINRGGWRSGNALVILTNQTFWQQWDLRFWHYDGAPDKAPRLTITWTENETSFTWQVSASLDDANGEGEPGHYWQTDALGPLYSDDQVDRLFYTGQRFTGINITSGSTITSAKLIMTSRFDYAVNDTRQFRIQAEDVDNASQFSTQADYLARPRTSASVLWNFTDDPYVNSSHLSPDLKDVIQEVIDRSGWKSGNALVIFTSQTFWQQWDLRFWHYDGAPDNAPRLTITWIPGPGVVEEESSFTWQISTSLDDAGGEISGRWWLTALGPLYSDDQVDRLFYTGQRFTGINITSGSTITSAKLIMTSRFDYAVNDTRQFRIQAEDVDHASQFSTQADYLARPRTSASVLWNFTEDPYVNSSHLSPDLKDVIQEVINRGGWRSGNALVILTNQTFWQQWDLRFWHYDGAPDKAPRLTITWTEGARTPSDSILIDSYDESSRDGWATINGNHPSDDWARSAFYQSFQNLNGTYKITSVKFYLRKVGSPTGTAYVKLYAHGGTYGTSSVPTGDPLATSDGFDVSTLTGDYQLITFNFSGGEQYQMSPNSYYCIQLEAPSDGTIDISNYIRVSQDESTPTHGGNVGYWRNNEWIVNPSDDGYFYVYGDAVSDTGMG